MIKSKQNVQIFFSVFRSRMKICGSLEVNGMSHKDGFWPRLHGTPTKCKNTTLSQILYNNASGYNLNSLDILNSHISKFKLAHKTHFVKTEWVNCEREQTTRFWLNKWSNCSSSHSQCVSLNNCSSASKQFLTYITLHHQINASWKQHMMGGDVYKQRVYLV